MSYYFMCWLGDRVRCWIGRPVTVMHIDAVVLRDDLSYEVKHCYHSCRHCHVRLAEHRGIRKKS